MQAYRCRSSTDRYLQLLLPADSLTVVSHRTVDPGQVQQALRHRHGLAQ
jgi:hypothetical protein